MDPTLALTGCAVIVAIFVGLECRRRARVSAAVWLPTAWLLISGSRPLGMWVYTANLPLEATVEAGSPIDRWVLSALMATAVAVSVRRHRLDWVRLGQINIWLLLMFLYMAASILWSEFPAVSFKRWIRALGPLFMGLALVSERRPLEAFEVAVRRTAYVLIPLSLVLVKYYPEFGVQYGQDGQLMWTGATLQKNGLGQLCAVSVLLQLWMTMRARRAGLPHSLRGVDVLVGSIALFLLRGPAGSYSATSFAILAAGCATLFVLYTFPNLASFALRRLGFFSALAVLMYWVSSEWLIRMMAPIVGRDSTLTGRATIWHTVLGVASEHPILGVGYGGFWGLHPEITSALRVGQSHNGYLGVYLELGLIGVALLMGFVLALCRNARVAFGRQRDLGVLAACLLVVILLYNVAESAFLTSGFLWTNTLLVAMLTSWTATNSGAAADRPKTSLVEDVAQDRRWIRHCSRGDSFRNRPARIPQSTRMADGGWP